MEAPPTQPLAKETITKTEIAFEGLKRLQQPFESFGGLGAEDMQSFNQRISERLRHKNRSWNIWDVERLVLQNFPAVFKAKCISHSTRMTVAAPRRVLVVVVPFSLGTSLQNRLQPRVSIATREAIKIFLRSKTTPFVQLSVENPIYEVVKLTFDVRFLIADDYYKQQLNDDIRQFLSPWTVTNKPDVMTFGGRLYKSSLINFIEERPYVQFVAGFQMEKLDTDGRILATDAPMVEGSAENVVLTSDLQHIIRMI